ncbi:MAG: LPS export ABC transporter periplasmic protein LptC [Thermaurantiacus sp.]
MADTASVPLADRRSAAAEARREARRQAMLPGSARDTWISVLRVALPAAAVMLFAVILWLPLTANQEFSFLLSKDTTAAAGERLLAQEARYRGETDNGEPFELRAERAVQQTSTVPVVMLTGLSARIERADGEARVTAPSGNYNLDTQMIGISGPVEVRSESGFSLDSAAIIVDLNRRTVTTDEAVTGAVPLGTFRADSFAADIEGRRVVMEGGVRLRMAPGSGRGSS